MHNQPFILGVDFGGVINDGSAHPSGDDTAFLTGGDAAAMATPATAGVFDALARLTAVFDGRVYVVSKCGPRIQKRTTQWLHHHRFFERTGVDTQHVRFCRERPEKAAICRELAITHFVDDRGDVLAAMAHVVAHRYLFGSTSFRVPPGATRVANWTIAERLITASVVRGPVTIRSRDW